MLVRVGQSRFYFWLPARLQTAAVSHGSMASNKQPRVHLKQGLDVEQCLQTVNAKGHSQGWTLEFSLMFVIYFVFVLEEGFNQTLMMIEVQEWQVEWTHRCVVPETKYKTSLHANTQKFLFSGQLFVVSVGVYQSHGYGLTCTPWKLGMGISWKLCDMDVWNSVLTWSSLAQNSRQKFSLLQES